MPRILLQPIALGSAAIALAVVLCAVAQPAASAPRKQKGLYQIDTQGTGVSYRKGFALGVGVNVIEADLSDPDVRIGAMIASGGIGSAEAFGRMIRRANPAAAITGTFFGMRNNIPTGDLVINGQSVFRGFIGTAVAISEGNVVSFIHVRKGEPAVDWSLFDTVIRGGPRLVERGKVMLTARKEGFRTLPITARRPRTAVGLTRDNRLQFVAVRQGITLWELAKVMKALGAYQAVALDGGTSTAMYFAGNFVAYPGRALTNVLMIYHRRDRFDAAKPRFAAGLRPAPPRAITTPGAPTVATRPMGSFAPAQGLDFPVKDASAPPMSGADKPARP